MEERMNELMSLKKEELAGIIIDLEENKMICESRADKAVKELEVTREEYKKMIERLAAESNSLKEEIIVLFRKVLMYQERDLQTLIGELNKK